MKKIYMLQKWRGFLQHSFVLLLLLSFFSGTISAQTYVNGNLSTGATSSNGTAAPAGFTWSEVQAGNINAGFGANIAAGLTIADDFVVPAGPSWNITKVTFYAYSTGWAGGTSPFNDTRIQIYNTNPSVGAPAPIYGNLTANVFSNATSSGMYRIFNATPDQTRRIWKIEANVSTTLAPGTYWIEWQHGLTGATSNFSPASTVVGTVTQPGNNAQQRTVATNAWINLVDGANLQDMPFSIDYTTGPCGGTPAPGNTIASATTVCPGIPVLLSLQNATSGSGVTYQWFSGPSLTGPFAPIAGATNSTLSTTQSVATWYQATVTCSGNTGTSLPVGVALTPTTGCYCAAGATDVTFEKISNVAFGTINNPSTSTGGYENFTALSTTIIRQSTTPITVSISNAFAADQVFVWVDLNQNGNFTDAGELLYTSPNGVGPHTGNITIPVTASLGSTRMRIRMHDASLGPNNTPCGNSTYGQVEDYTINIVPCVQGVFTTQPTSGAISCAGSRTFTVAATGSGLTFSWQQRVSATAPWTTVTNGTVNGAVITGATTANLVLSNVPSTYNGYQYRALMVGPCTAVDYSSVATLTVNPLTALVVPTSATICSGAIQALNIVNPGGFGAVTTQTFTSGTIAVPIPDNTPAGGNHTIVSTTPLGAAVSQIRVTFTMSHTYSGDVAAVLKAPNGQVLNLDYFISGTGAAGNGFVNTIISSQTTPVLPLLSSNASPYTGIFRPDAVLTGNPAPGPTGFAPTTTNFAALFSQADGNWTFAAYDAFNLDAGVLTSWSIEITYRPIAPLSGTWTSNPATPNTMWTDAAATVPYVAGTPVTGIYVNPTTQGVTNYVVSVISPTCTVAPFTIPVTVNTPVGAVPAPSNAATCADGTASFTVTPASGGAFTYQWQVSTDNGTTWTNIANDANYSGATTATLSLVDIPANWNTRQYRAVVSVAACSSTVNSGAATLTVNPTPTITLAAAPYTNLYPGITTTITATVAPAGATYQWFQNGLPVPGATGPSIVVDVDHVGDYSVSVTDVNGCSATSAALTIGSAPNDIMFIYPSPTTGQFQVRYYNTPGNSVARTLTIYDSKGSRVFFRTYSVNTPYNQMDVDLKQHGHGIYRVELGDLNGKRIKVGSVLVL